MSGSSPPEHIIWAAILTTHTVCTNWINLISAQHSPAQSVWPAVFDLLRKTREDNVPRSLSDSAGQKTFPSVALWAEAGTTAHNLDGNTPVA